MTVLLGQLLNLLLVILILLVVNFLIEVRACAAHGTRINGLVVLLAAEFVATCQLFKNLHFYLTEDFEF